jgi:molybdopterin/thiamine biosynthesis adenylyltransferase
MEPPTITIATPEKEDRFSRFRLIPWWDQEKIQSTRVLVIGAGALGNEILKNLALLGFRKIAVVDMDRIDESNLSRTVLYRKEDVGKLKAQVAAHAIEAMCPDATVWPLVANVVRDCGLGVFLWSDLILAGLDNREARLWINRSAWKMNRPWIDGAIEGINGVARVFLPGAPPCYECTLGETDWKLLERRMSCNLLAHEADVEGKVATTPTISSIIAGIQVQEAVKLIHGLPTLASRGFVFEGLNHTSYPVTYTENADCMSHYTLKPIVELQKRSEQITLREILEKARQDIGSDEVTIEFSRDIIAKLTCPSCHNEERRFTAVGSVHYHEGRCPRCGQMRTVVTAHSYDGGKDEDFGDVPINALGLPLYDVFTARTVDHEMVDREMGYLISGDRQAVLGPLGAESTA